MIPGKSIHQKGQDMNRIQVLGTGCARCRELTANAEQALRDLGLPVVIEKVTGIK